jgi:hypothetical protein
VKNKLADFNNRQFAQRGHLTDKELQYKNWPWRSTAHDGRLLGGRIIENTGLALDVQVKKNEQAAMNSIRHVEAEWFAMTADGYEPECNGYIADENECDYGWKARGQELAPVIKALSIYEIIKTVSRCMGVPLTLLRSPSRRSSAVRARWVVMYLARIKTQATLEEIGIALNRDHSSVIHGIKIVKRDRELLDCVRRIQAEMF